MKKIILLGVSVLILVTLVGCGGKSELQQVNSQAAKEQCQANLRTIDGALAMYSSGKGTDPKSIQDLVNAGYLKEVPTCPSGPRPYELVGKPGSLHAYCPNDPSHKL